MTSLFIYNVTVKVELEIHDEWLDWMKNIHIPEVLSTQKFIDAKMMKVLVGEDDGATYAIQYRFETPDDFEQYQKLHAPTLQQKTKDKYGEKALAFRTLMKEI